MHLFCKDLCGCHFALSWVYPSLFCSCALFTSTAQHWVTLLTVKCCCGCMLASVCVFNIGCCQQSNSSARICYETTHCDITDKRVIKCSCQCVSGCNLFFFFFFASQLLLPMMTDYYQTNITAQSGFSFTSINNPLKPELLSPCFQICLIKCNVIFFMSVLLMEAGVFASWIY